MFVLSIRITDRQKKGAQFPISHVHLNAILPSEGCTMPELPEVETLCRQLNTVLPGEKILRIEVLDPRLGNIERKRGHSATLFPGSVPDGSGTEKIAGLVGRRVAAVTRRGKGIHIQMDGGLTAALHLRMSGRLLYLAADIPPPSKMFPYSRMVIGFSSGTLVLIDPRRFATFAVQPEGINPALPDDPMEGLPARRLREIAGTRRRPVKFFLMDQRLIAGIGNIYACEILFAAGIDPRRPACSLTTAEWRKTAKAAAFIFHRAVTCRGTTVSDWRDLFGCSGTNQDHLEVYSRQGAPCRRCGGSIERINQGGRGTWLCPICQK
jgi:formamidopyrimidine-DNA glycosylase